MNFSKEPPAFDNFSLLQAGCWATVLLAALAYVAKMLRAL